MEEKKPVVFQYSDGQTYRVNIVKMYYEMPFWYMDAWDLDADQAKTFKMLDVKRVDQ